MPIIVDVAPTPKHTENIKVHIIVGTERMKDDRKSIIIDGMLEAKKYLMFKIERRKAIVLLKIVLKKARERLIMHEATMDE